MEKKRDTKGNIMGRANDNPIRDNRQYVVKFDSGEVTELTANVFSQSIYSMCDKDDYQVLLFDAIVEHKRDETVMIKADQTFVGAIGIEYFRLSSRGLKLCIIWKDGSTTWEKLSDFKECYPVETAEYATARDLADEPEFNWWVNQTLKKHDCIISLVNRRNTRYLKKTSKYGIELPKSVADA